MDLGLDGAVAWVVGGTGLIGRAVAEALHAEGATVVIGARDEKRLAEVSAGIGADVDTVVVDTADQASIDAAVAQIVERHGGIGVLVNTAAPPASSIDPARSSDPAMVAEAFEGKAMGYLRVTNVVLPHMTAAGHGRVVQIAGMHAYLTRSVAATTRNAAVVTATACLADEVAGSGVTLNVVHPGPVLEDASAAVPHAQYGESSPAQVAALVVFLASGPAGAISGESVSVGHKLRGFLAY